MKIGFIGTGNFANQHAEILKEMQTDIVGCYGTNLIKTKDFSDRHNCKIFNNPNELISKKLIDLLYIVIPPFAHDGLVELKAIENKIPFLCEKPVGLNLSLCEKIAKDIDSTGLITSSGYLLRYESLFSEVKNIISRNLISTIRICSYSYMPQVKWWGAMEKSGGMMVEAGSHYIDLLRYLFGEVESVAAYKSEGIAANSYNANIYDSMEAIIKFRKGCIGSIGVTHLLNKINARNDVLEVYGDNFSLKIDLYKLRYCGEAQAEYKEIGDSDWKIITGKSDKKKLMKSLSAAFLSAIASRKKECIMTSYPDAVKSLEVALAMNESCQKGIAVKVK